jgi:hypothetical protein
MTDSPRSPRLSTDALEARLVADVEAARPVPPARLRPAIVATIRSAAAAAAAGPSAAADEPSTPRPGLLAAPLAAAAALLIALPFLLNRDDPDAAAPAATPAAVAAGVDDLFEMRDLLAWSEEGLLALADDPLQAEADRLWSDASRAAEGLVATIPAPLRRRFEAR